MSGGMTVNVEVVGGRHVGVSFAVRQGGVVVVRVLVRRFKMLVDNKH